MNRAYIAFGANMSNPRETFMRSIEAMALSGIIVDRVSSLWHSAAWPPGEGAPDYQNAALAIRTEMSADDLLRKLLSIETRLGRVRSVPNAPRTCDLDLIDYAGQVSDDPYCTVPHPRLQDRDFVLWPLSEVIDRDWTHPLSGLTVQQLLEALDEA